MTDTSVSDWYGVTVNGKSGYMFSEYITMNGSNSGSTDSSASSDTMRTTAYLNLRSGTGTDTNVLTVIPEGRKRDGFGKDHKRVVQGELRQPHRLCFHRILKVKSISISGGTGIFPVPLLFLVAIWV